MPCFIGSFERNNTKRVILKVTFTVTHYRVVFKIQTFSAVHDNNKNNEKKKDCFL